MRIHIYTIWFPTSKKYYIGQTNDLVHRLLNHIYTNSLVGRSLSKYNDWQISVLHTCKTRDEANRIEIEEIRNFNSVVPNGYNLTRGGSGSFGYNPSKETKRKNRDAHIGNKNAVGYVHSEEHNRKISEANKGKKHSLETCEKIGLSSKGRCSGDKNPSKNHVVVLKQQRTKLKNKLVKLEREIQDQKNFTA